MRHRVWSAAMAVTVFGAVACGSDDSPTAPSSTRAMSLTGDLHFGTVPVGQLATRTLTIANTGRADLTITAVTGPANFSASWTSGVIAAGASRDTVITFAPGAVQVFQGVVTVHGNHTGGTNTIPVSGAGVSAAWQFSGQISPTHGGLLSGVRIDFAGVGAETGADGRFSFLHESVSTAPMTVTHPGLVDRQVWLRGGEPRSDLLLDPIALASPFDLGFYRQMVRNHYDAPGSLQPLRRWTAPPNFYIQTTEHNGEPVDPATIEMVMAGIDAGVRGLTPFQPGRIETGPEARSPAAGWINVVFEPLSPQRCGQALVGANPGRIWFDLAKGCRRSGDPQLGIWIVMHEVGHAMGFWHTPPGHVMYGFLGGGATSVTEIERFHAALAYRRPNGNADPDADPASALAVARDLVPMVVSCGR